MRRTVLVFAGLGIAAMAACVVWLRFDWLARTWRAAVLFIGAGELLPLLGLWLHPPALYLVYAPLAAGLLAPVVLHHRAIVPFAKEDAAMVLAIDDIAARVATASRLVQSGRMDPAGYTRRLEAEIQQLRELRPADPDLQRFVNVWTAELNALATHPTRREGSDLIRQPPASEAAHLFARIVRARASFWR